MSIPTIPAGPTSTQIAYIRDLNIRTGTQYAHPLTSEAARFEINRLNRLLELQDRAVERFTCLLEDSGLPTPDEIQRTDQQIRFVWIERKVIAVVDLADLESVEA
jgi:hypothetical protein